MSSHLVNMHSYSGCQNLSFHLFYTLIFFSKKSCMMRYNARVGCKISFEFEVKFWVLYPEEDVHWLVEEIKLLLYLFVYALITIIIYTYIHLYACQLCQVYSVSLQILWPRQCTVFVFNTPWRCPSPWWRGMLDKFTIYMNPLPPGFLC